MISQIISVPSVWAKSGQAGDLAETFQYNRFGPAKLEVHLDKLFNWPSILPSPDESVQLKRQSVKGFWLSWKYILTGYKSETPGTQIRTNLYILSEFVEKEAKKEA